MNGYIAEVVGVPIGTVMSRLHRSRRRLITDLAELAAEHRLPRVRAGAAGAKLPGSDAARGDSP